MPVTLQEIVRDPLSALVETVELLRDRLAAHTALIHVDEQAWDDAKAFASADLILDCRFTGRLAVDLSEVPDGMLAAVSAARYRHVVFDRDLRGPDGNVFAVIGRICQLLRDAGASKAEIDAFTAEAGATNTYRDALACCARWVTMPMREEP